jgi:hypothetical protein
VTELLYVAIPLTFGLLAEEIIFRLRRRFGRGETQGDDTPDAGAAE